MSPVPQSELWKRVDADGNITLATNINFNESYSVVESELYAANQGTERAMRFCLAYPSKCPHSSRQPHQYRCKLVSEVISPSFCNMSG